MKDNLSQWKNQKNLFLKNKLFKINLSTILNILEFAMEAAEYNAVPYVLNIFPKTFYNVFYTV